MKPVSTALLLIALIAPTAYAVRQTVPIAGHLPGANGTMWTTDLMLFNAQPQAETVRLRFRPAALADVYRDVVLEGGASVLLSDAVDPALFPGENPESWIGQLEVIADGSVYVHARVYTRAVEGEGTYGSTMPVLDPTSFLTRGILSGLVANAQYRTNLTFVNPSIMTVRFFGQLRDPAGSAIGSRFLVSVGPYESVQQSLVILVAEPLDGAGYSVEWESPDWEGFVMASVIDNASGDPTAIPSTGSGSTSLMYPIVGRTPGAAGTDWATSLALTADSSTAGVVTLELLDNEEGVKTLVREIGPWETILLADIYEAFGISSGTGSLAVSATVPVAGVVRLFNTVGTTTYGSLIPSQEEEGVSGFLHIRGVTISDEYRFNIAIANREFADAGGLIRLYDGRRNTIWSEEFFVPARTTVQIAIPSSVAVEAGELTVMQNQNRLLSAVGSNVDNRSGDTVILPAKE